MYMAVSETAKSHGKSGSISRAGRKTAAILLAVLALTAGAGTVNLAAAANNASGSGDGVAVGTGSSAPKAENVAIGKGATIKYSNGASKSTGDVAVGSGAVIDNYASQGGSIAIGKNAKVENMAGGGEASFAFGQTTFSGTEFDESRIPADPSKVIGSIAIGDNTFARTGSTMIGSHNYKGELGDTTVDSTSTRTYALNVYATTVGANSFSNGAFTTNTGSYNIISSEYNGGRSANPVKNMGATITGALNSIESIGADDYSGIANTVSGIANRTSNSNGTLIYGAGNEVTNSITSLEDIPTDSGNSAKAFSEKLRGTIKASNSGGATLAIGGGNKIDNAIRSQAIGVNNTLTGNLYHEDGLSIGSRILIPAVNEYSAQYNMVDGYNNNVANVNHAYVIGANNNIQGKTFSDATKDGVLSDKDREKAKKDDNLIVIGDNHTLANDVSNNIILGTADKTLTTRASNIVMIGHNADAQKEGGVALGADSVAAIDKDAVGYDPANGDHQTDTTGTWKSTAAAVSVGDASKHITRQITNVAAGTQDTDAVNVAQLKNALSGAKDHNDTLQADQNALKLEGNTLSMSVKDTAGNEVSGSVDLSKFAQAVDTNTTYTLTGEANPDNNTTTITLSDNSGNKNGVTVATKDTRNTVKAGENVTLDTKDNADGSHEYTVNVKADGKVEAGSTKIVSGGTVYNETRVQKDGTYVKASNTAGENLTALDSQVASNAGAVNELNGRVNRLDSRINKVGAGAAALAALHPLDFNPDDKWDFAVGYGNYRNANSVALGAFYRPNENTMLSLGTNFGNGENMFNAGVSFKIGKGNSYAGYSKVEMAKVIDTQSREVAALKEENAKNAKDNAVMKAEIEALKKQVEALAAKK